MSETERGADHPGRDFTQGFVQVNGVRVGYWEAGSGPPLVMLPGSAGLEFSLAMDALSRDFRVIAMDPPGWGAAPADGQAPNREALAEQMAGAVAALGIERYAVVGTSMGGSIALLMGLDHPERIDSMILDGPIEFRGHGHMPTRDPRTLMRPAFNGPPPGKPWATKEFFQEQHRRRVRLFECGYDRGPEYDEALAERCKGLTVPTLVLYGADDAVILPSCGREYKALIPRCEFIMVYGSNHNIQYDRPEAYAEVVRDFLQRGTPAFLFSARSAQLNP